MQLQIDTNLQAFKSEVLPFLEKEATLHSFIRGFLHRYVEIQKPMALLVRLLSDGGALVGIGIQTDVERALILSNLTHQQSQKLAELLAPSLDSLLSVTGPSRAVDGFAEIWGSLKQKRTVLYTNLRLFELTRLEKNPSASGAARTAVSSDAPLIFKWLREFEVEALPHETQGSDEVVRKSIELGIEKEQFFLWDDGGESVCLVASRRETEDERWIAPVYTPVRFRGRGYGSALTAFVSHRILDSGKKGMLFTDLSNPTSNSIYQKIGYRPVGDFKHVGFE